MRGLFEILAPAAAASAVVIQSTVTVGAPSVTGLLDPVSTMILGSLVGATVAIGLGKKVGPEPEGDVIKRLFLQFGISLGCGVLFTPGVFRYFHLPFDAEFVGPVAVLIAASAVGLLNRLLPVVKSRAVKFFNSFR